MGGHGKQTNSSESRVSSTRLPWSTPWRFLVCGSAPPPERPTHRAMRRRRVCFSWRNAQNRNYPRSP
eukprot:2846788-Amphidinium_carterae.1